ncbi:MAG: exodeoxyribonuclease VII small subunit [Methylotenera sp.]|nr:exodeoxyribonuclease VII small subunit [Methylotenera sp.]
MSESTQKNMFETTDPALENISSFEQAFAELESIVSQMESGQIPLETSLAAYKRGDLLLQYCQKYLAEVEQQVQILNERNQLSTFKTGNDE